MRTPFASDANGVGTLYRLLVSHGCVSTRLFVRSTWVTLWVAEHANLRAPLWLDRVLSLVTTWPRRHKVHHSRLALETDTNYSNLFSVWDRFFFTFTPSARGRHIRYGLDGLDDPASQTVSGLLRLPFRS